MKIACPECDRSFAQANDVYNHMKTKHGAAKARRFRRASMPEHMPEFDQSHAATSDRSIGSELADALLSVSIGEEVPEHIALMFPDEVAEARQRSREARR